MKFSWVGFSGFIFGAFVLARATTSIMNNDAFDVLCVAFLISIAIAFGSLMGNVK